MPKPKSVELDSSEQPRPRQPDGRELKGGWLPQELATELPVR
jgi:hypothetical protein